MRETQADLRRLQGVLDESHERAGSHLRSIITPERRLKAGDLASRLTGMKLLALATVTSSGTPVAGPVDGIFYRGEFWFGTSPSALRIRHIRRNPAVSATHVPGRGIGGHRPRHGAHRGSTGGIAGRVRRSLPRNLRGRLAGMGQGRALLSHRASSHVHVLPGWCGRWVNRGVGGRVVWSTSNPCQREIASGAVKPLPGTRTPPFPRLELA